MSKLKFSVPYNNNPNGLNEIIKLKDEKGDMVQEIYLPPPIKYFTSGRISPDIEMEDFTNLIDLCHKNGLTVNLLLNGQCEGLGWYKSNNVEKVIKFLKFLNTKHNLKSVTIANPLYLQKIRKSIPKIKITASILGYIGSVQRAMFYENLGADIITLDRDINRNFKILEEIKEATVCKLRLMVNEGCLFRCPYRLFHFNLISHWSKKGDIPSDRFFFNCYHINKLDPSQILKSHWIRPEDLKKYKKITNFFKISGRTRKTEWLVNVIKAYTEKKWDGNFLDLMDSSLNEFKKSYKCFIDNRDLDGFLDKVADCDENCLECNYCEDLAEKIVKFE